jgi:hypothetical protein
MALLTAGVADCALHIDGDVESLRFDRFREPVNEVEIDRGRIAVGADLLVGVLQTP